MEVSDGSAAPEAEVPPSCRQAQSPGSVGLSGCQGQEQGRMAPARWDVGTSISAHSQDLRGFFCRDEQRGKIPLPEQGRRTVPVPRTPATPRPPEPASPGPGGHIQGLLPTGLASGLVLADGC